MFPAGPHVGRYGTKNVQKKVRKNVRQICYILFANSRVCGRVPGAMPLLTLQVAKFEVTLAWFCLVYTRACELLTLVQVVHWLVSVMFLQTCLTGGVLTCLGMFVCLAQVVHWPVWSCLSKPVESSGVYFTWPTDMFISCLTD